jgi:D-alanyl-D-alanine carboxypeptidase
VADLNRFYGLLLAGDIVDSSSLAEMQRTVSVISFEGKKIEYGPGLHGFRALPTARLSDAPFPYRPC